MGFPQSDLQAIRAKAEGRNVYILLTDGQTVCGLFIEATPSHIKLDLNGEIAYADITEIVAIRIEK